MSKFAKCALCVSFVAIALSVSLKAQAEMIVNIDSYSPGGAVYVGQGALGLGGTVWNDGSSGSVTNLLDSNGVATSIDYSVTAPAGTKASAKTNALTDTYNVSPQNGDPLTFTLSGLSSTKSYDLVLYGSQDAWGGVGTKFTIGGVSQQTDGIYTTVPAGGFDLGHTHVVFAGLTPDGSGNIIVTWQGIVSPTYGMLSGILNGLQISEVPEPSAIVLLGVGLAGLLAYAWRRRK